MTVDDLRVILGKDGIARRMFKLTINTNVMINCEEHINGDWVQNSYLYVANVNHYEICEHFNIRRCIYFRVLKTAINCKKTVMMYSGIVVEN